MTIHFTNLYKYLENDYIAQQCLKSWQKNMPDAEIKIWTENDEYIKKVLNRKSKFLNWVNFSKARKSFLCDYIRLNLLYDFGGVYSELDQFLIKPLKFEENFCLNLFWPESLNTEFLPNYFKKGNKLLKYLINYLDKDFSWLSEKDKNYRLPNEINFCKVRNLNESLKKEYDTLIENSRNFYNKNGYFAFHLVDWWLFEDYKISFLSFNESMNEDFLNAYVESVKGKNKITFFISEDNSIYKKKDLGNTTFLIEKSYAILLIKCYKYIFSKNSELKKKLENVNNLYNEIETYEIKV